MALYTDPSKIPDVLILPKNRRSAATYVDLNPIPSNDASSVLLYDAQAVFASIRNLLLCPKGGRSRIFQEDYFSGLYELLQEPFDDITAGQIRVAIVQALQIWEPRVTINTSEIEVKRDVRIPGYNVSMTITVNRTTARSGFYIPIS